MKKRYFCIFILCLCIVSLSNTVFATNWVRVGTDEYYIDSDTPIRKGKVLYYWEVYIDTAGHKRLGYYGIDLRNPRGAHLMKGYYYNQDNLLMNEIVRPHGFSVWPGSDMDKAIDLALTYAKEGEPTDTIPTLP
ncbi:MAG: hypothetical protein H6Q67_1971 [Firmicutes bacterium]|nr:hypothetical protein [Bacillota bacterium]